MGNRYFYEFTGRIFVKSENGNQAEQMIMDIDLNDYIVDEELYEIDEHYIPIDLKQRQGQMGTEYHPLDDPEEYEKFKIREYRYGNIVNDFLNGKIDRIEMLKRMDQADGKEIDGGSLIYKVQMVDLETKDGKTAKLIPGD